MTTALKLADCVIQHRDLEWHRNATAELRMLYHALQDWGDKTYWVQKTATPTELGRHRADALRTRIETLEVQKNELLKALKAIDQACEMALAAMGPVGPDLICNVSHHAKKDRHELSEPCPIQKRWLTAYQTLRAAIEALREVLGGTNGRG